MDFDGTLAPIVSNPASATASPEVYQLLKKSQGNQTLSWLVVDLRIFREELKGIDCDMAFEHGALYFDRRQKKVKTLFQQIKISGTPKP